MPDQTLEEPLEIDLVGEAKAVAEELAGRYGVTSGDVVARALGFLKHCDDEQFFDDRHIISERYDGSDRRVLPTTVYRGDAQASGPR